MRKKKEVTMQDIANCLKISKVTVSKALNDKEGVSAELKVKIKEVANEMGYKVSSGIEEYSGPKNIAILVREKFTTNDSNFYLKFYQKITVELSKKGYIGNLFTITQENDKKNELPRLFFENNISGIILLGHVKKQFVEVISNLKIPMLFVDFYQPDSDIDSIVTDNFYSTYELTNHLIKKGHKDIGFIGSIYATSSIQDRYLGYCRSLIGQRIEVRKDWIIDDRDEESENIEFKLPDEMPTAFVCNCDDTAYRFVNCLKQKGYRIPEDISIVSFDNDIYAELCVPRLTTVAVDIQSMAKKSANLIAEKVENPGAHKHGKVFMGGNIIYRDSVCER